MESSFTVPILEGEAVMALPPFRKRRVPSGMEIVTSAFLKHWRVKPLGDGRGLLNRWDLRVCVSSTLLSSNGSVSEWLGAGLQTPLRRSDSDRNL